MQRLIAYFIRYPIWANVTMLAILGCGYFSYKNLKTSFFPEVESSTIVIEVIYPGTSPQEIEEGLVLKIEQSLKGIPGIEQTTSVSSEGRGRVSVSVWDHDDLNAVLMDVKNAVDRISPYPAGAEKPLVYTRKVHTRSISVAIYADSNLWALKERAERFRDDLLDIEGISQVSLAGIPTREIAIEVTESTLQRYDMSFDTIEQAIKRSNLDLSGGKIDSPNEEILIRAYGRKDTADDIRQLVLANLPSGGTLRIGDIATVTEQWADTPNRTYYNGKRALIVNVDKTLDEDILYISHTVREHAKRFAERYPEVKVQVTDDPTIYLRERIQLLQKNGLIGFILVILALSLFLRWRIAFWVAIGIPISFAGMFIVANWVGITINIVSLLGMIIVVGMLVDDAIVISEKIYQKYESGVVAIKAAINGTLHVLAPVFTTVLTTMLAFLPFFFFNGGVGKIIWHVALVVIASLIFSLIESVLILPVHLAHSKCLRADISKPPIRAALDNFFQRMTVRVFGGALRWALHHPLVILSIPIANILLTLGLLRGNIIQFSAFPYIDQDRIWLNITMTPGTQPERTDAVLTDIEAKVWTINKALKAERKDHEDVIRSIQRETEGHVGLLSIELLPSEQRKMPAFLISNKIRDQVGKIPGLQKFSFDREYWPKPISISLLSDDRDQLDTAKERLKSALRAYRALKDVIDTDAKGRREIRLSLKPAAYAVGLRLQDVATQVRKGFFGQEIQRIQRGKDEIRVWVRLTHDDRSSIHHLETMRLRTPSGHTVPLDEIATYEIVRGRVNIIHLDGKREVRVEADLKNPNDSVATIMHDIKSETIPTILSGLDNVQVSYEGQERDNIKFKRSLQRTFPMTLLGILILLILIFRSYLQPIIIFLMIPMGILGALWGHLIHDIHVSRLSMFGIIALSGIVINDSIVYIDQINRNLKEGALIMDAIWKAGISRFRPILLTTITTVAGLGPLILEKSLQAQFLIPMAVSIAYGLIFGTSFVLFVVPVLFLTLNRIRCVISRLKGEHVPPETLEPAVSEERAS